MATKYHELAKFVESIGKSVEGRDQPAFHITAAKDDVNKIYFQCQIHASEFAYCRLFTAN
jgi:murein tripeptide amidase MpaA